MNTIRRIFNPTPEEDEEDRQQLNDIIQTLIEDKCCGMCEHSIPKPHIEMGYDLGTDNYCPIYDQLMLEYGYGQQCIFWKLKKDISIL